MPPQLNDPKRRKVLIYAGIAGAMLLLAILSRRGQQQQAAQQPATAQPVSNPAVDPASYYSGGSGAGGVDYGPQLATLDTDVQTLAQAVAAQQSAAQTPGPSTPGTGGTDTGIMLATIAAVSAGAQLAKPPPVNVTVTSPKQPGPGNTKPRKPPAKPKPAPHKGQPAKPPARPRPPTSRAAKRHG